MKEIEPFNTHAMKLRPGRACLLVIDMQNEFLEEEGSIFFHYAAEVVPNIKRTLHAARKANIPVIFTGHVHSDPRLDGGLTAEWWPEIKKGRCLIAGTRGVEIHSALRPLEHEKIVWKHRYSAFYNTDLETILRCLGVTDLIITGVLTNVCCESTARDAFFRDFRVFIPADATATTEPELHVASLKNLAYAFACITTTRQLLAEMIRR
jgi:ureidoacrylate peracid hydrolase